MSLSLLSSLLVKSPGPDEDSGDAPPSDVTDDDEDELAGAIESWFEKGDEYDRRYGGVDRRAS